MNVSTDAPIFKTTEFDKFEIVNKSKSGTLVEGAILVTKGVNCELKSTEIKLNNVKIANSKVLSPK